MNPRLRDLINKKHIVDRFHINNHVDSWCLKNCNPNIRDDLKGVNTVVVEEINYWLGGYKHMIKHMNYERFHFFIYIISDHYNMEKIKHKI